MAAGLIFINRSFRSAPDILILYERKEINIKNKLLIILLCMNTASVKTLQMVGSLIVSFLSKFLKIVGWRSSCLSTR